MFCKHCGSEINENEKFCSNCGAQIEKESIVEKIHTTAEDVFQKSEEELKNAFHDAAGTSGTYNGGGNMGGQGPLKVDRNLVTYILLSIVTCGIYSYYFIYKIAADVNVACEGDGKSTGGLVQFILLSFITCGIYAWVWYYGLGNRLWENASRYGLNFTENGTTVLLWLIFGSLICGLGQFFAMYILIKNTNAICDAYNRQNGYY